MTKSLLFIVLALLAVSCSGADSTTRKPAQSEMASPAHDPTVRQDNRMIRANGGADEMDAEDRDFMRTIIRYIKSHRFEQKETRKREAVQRLIKSGNADARKLFKTGAFLSRVYSLGSRDLYRSYVEYLEAKVKRIDGLITSARKNNWKGWMKKLITVLARSKRFKILLQFGVTVKDVTNKGSQDAYKMFLLKKQGTILRLVDRRLVNLGECYTSNTKDYETKDDFLAGPETVLDDGVLLY
ncbi:hypothetical protein PsorP6_012792 [Peronosclerospora sorghi]|uniref:Uncharacterized protein n=1 Tax=Peronosclerospora sorghi TaxID=230839 RepID=A0ACC0WHX0_9STRA|nr:hypothetical protein PsorP6_012792 [Peronosclerospora sorghi]